MGLITVEIENNNAVGVCPFPTALFPYEGNGSPVTFVVNFSMEVMGSNWHQGKGIFENFLF